MSSLITVASFSHPLEAHLCRTRLEHEGIPCFLADEHTIAANWFYSQAVGGVKLQVHARDHQHATAVLASYFERAASPTAPDAPALHAAPHAGTQRFETTRCTDEADADEACCPHCHSTEVYYEKFSRPLVFLSILLVGLPFPFLSRRWSCQSCGYEWKIKLFP